MGGEESYGQDGGAGGADGGGGVALFAGGGVREWGGLRGGWGAVLFLGGGRTEGLNKVDVQGRWWGCGSERLFKAIYKKVWTYR